MRAIPAGAGSGRSSGQPRAARGPAGDLSGDQPIAIGVDGDAALFGVLDGLGHGAAAAAPALRAVDAVERARTERLEVLLELCHRVLAGTRGVAMTLARVDFTANTLTWSGVGNVTANLIAKNARGVHVRSSARLAAGIVGYRVREIRPAQVVPIRAGDLMVVASDGIAEYPVDGIDFAAPASGIAELILDQHAKDTDDAMVLTARHRGPTR